jgi:cold shock protein
MSNAILVNAERHQGQVKWFNPEKGYGFINTDAGQEVFVHYSTIKSDGYKTLEQHARVEFDIEQSSKGLSARNVVVIS